MARPLNKNRVFVFGSNTAGIHGAGAAKYAYESLNARWGASYGHIGQTFAIPTKDDILQTLPMERIQAYITGFLAYATDHRKMEFQITRLGCGLDGLKDQDIAPLFQDAPENCLFDDTWLPFLGPRTPLGKKRAYWITF